MQKVKSSKNFLKLKNKILGKFPFIHELKVDVIKMPQNNFKAIIKAHIPAYKPLVVSKTNSSFSYALEKSGEALMKQVAKYKKSKMA